MLYNFQLQYHIFHQDIKAIKALIKQFPLIKIGESTLDLFREIKPSVKNACIIEFLKVVMLQTTLIQWTKCCGITS